LENISLLHERCEKIPTWWHFWCQSLQRRTPGNQCLYTSLQNYDPIQGWELWTCKGIRNCSKKQVHPIGKCNFMVTTVQTCVIKNFLGWECTEGQIHIIDESTRLWTNHNFVNCVIYNRCLYYRNETLL